MAIINSLNSCTGFSAIGVDNWVSGSNLKEQINWSGADDDAGPDTAAAIII